MTQVHRLGYSQKLLLTFLAEGEDHTRRLTQRLGHDVVYSKNVRTALVKLERWGYVDSEIRRASTARKPNQRWWWLAREKPDE